MKRLYQYRLFILLLALDCQLTYNLLFTELTPSATNALAAILCVLIILTGLVYTLTRHEII